MQDGLAHLTLVVVCVLLTNTLTIVNVTLIGRRVVVQESAKKVIVGGNVNG